MRDQMIDALIIMAVAGLIISGMAARASGEPTNNSSAGISLSTDKATYSPGEPIVIMLKVYNHTGEEISFGFSSSKRYDFTIEDDKGKELWRWSDGRMFLMMLGEETIGPGREEITYTESYEGELRQGYYKIEGIFGARERPMSSSVIIVVR